jgi:hypothetical protein
MTARIEKLKSQQDISVVEKELPVPIPTEKIAARSLKRA